MAGEQHDVGVRTPPWAGVVACPLRLATLTCLCCSGGASARGLSPLEDEDCCTPRSGPSPAPGARPRPAFHCDGRGYCRVLSRVGGVRPRGRGGGGGGGGGDRSSAGGPACSAVAPWAAHPSRSATPAAVPAPGRRPRCGGAAGAAAAEAAQQRRCQLFAVAVGARELWPSGPSRRAAETVAGRPPSEHGILEGQRCQGWGRPGAPSRRARRGGRLACPPHCGQPCQAHGGRRAGHPATSESRALGHRRRGCRGLLGSLPIQHAGVFEVHHGQTLAWWPSGRARWLQ